MGIEDDIRRIESSLSILQVSVGDLHQKLNQLIVQKLGERKELNPENAEALKEKPEDYKLRPETA